MSLSLQRLNLRWIFFQSPKSGGRSLHGAPVRNIQKYRVYKLSIISAMPANFSFHFRQQPLHFIPQFIRNLSTTGLSEFCGLIFDISSEELTLELHREILVFSARCHSQGILAHLPLHLLVFERIDFTE
jgi:hypothetical protein